MNKFFLAIFLLSSALAQINIDKLIEIPAEKSKSLPVQNFNQNQSSGSFSGVAITTGDATPSYNSVDLTSSINITPGGSGEVGIYYNLVDSDGNSNWYVANLSIFLGNITMATDNAVTISGLKDTTSYSWKAAIAYKSNGVILALGATKQFSTIPYVPGQLKVPSQYSTIQAGLNAARESDTVLVAAGTYKENIMWPEVNGIKLMSAGDSSNTIIDGGGTSSVIYMNPSSATIDTTTLIQGFKIINGNNVKSGGGIFCKNAAIMIDKTVIADNKVVGNDADGAGIFAENSIIVIKNSIIRNNIGDSSVSSSNGGGIWAYRCLFRTENVIFKSNYSNQGGGAYFSQSIGTMKESTIENNTSSQLGGGLVASTGGPYAASGSDGIISIDNTIIRGNVSGGRGGGAMFQEGKVILNNSTIMKNSGSNGGGLCLDSIKEPIIKNSKIHSNTASGSGGGIFIDRADMVLENSILANNTATSGGGIYIDRLKTEETGNSISNTQIINNTATKGGGAYFTEYVHPTLKNVTISNNSKEGIYASVDEVISVSYSNIVNNDFGVYNATNASILNLANNYWGDSSGPYHPSQNASGKGDSVNIFTTVSSWLTAPNTDAPPIPAQNLKLDSQTVTSATFSWDASKMGDIEGYKIYYDTDSSGYPYANSIDLGNVVTKSLTGLTTGKTYYVGVTTYDTDGNESWYSKEVAVQLNNPPVISSINDVTINEDESTTVELKATDPEGDPISFILKKNNVEGDFINFDGASGAKTWIQTKNEMNEEDHPIPDEGDFTVSVWARANTDANELMEIYSQGKQPGNIYLGSSGNLGETKYIRAGDSWGNTGVSFPVDGMWHHYVITKSSSDAYLYLDGALAASKGAPIDNPNPEGSGLYIGKQYGEGREYFDGNIAELTVWDSELSAAEIKTIYNSGLFLSPMRDTLDYKSSDNVTIYYNLSEGQDSTVYGKESNSSELFYGKINGTVEWRKFRNPKIATSISGTTLTLNPDKDWNGEANYLVIATDGKPITPASSSAAFNLTVVPIQDIPEPFDWTSSASDTIIISKDNLSLTYDLKWSESDDVDNDPINYIVYAKIGQYSPEEIFDTTATSYSILYEDIAEGAFEGIPGNAATVRFSVWAHDGIDSVKAGGEDRVLYVNRYDYLSIESEGIPNEFALHENYPNPFNPTTQIRFDLPEMSNVTLTIYNMLGQKVRTFTMQSAPAGYHALTWNATNDYGAPISAGVYLYQLQTDGFVNTKKMILLK